jgi:FtsZ-binding cell division protein ZapB
MVTMATKLFTAVHSVKLSQIEINEVKVTSIKLISIN